MNNAIPRAESPKDVGVSAKVINEFLSDAKQVGYEFHSLMVIRHGKVAVEWYNEPYNKRNGLPWCSPYRKKLRRRDERIRRKCLR